MANRLVREQKKSHMVIPNHTGLYKCMYSYFIFYLFMQKDRVKKERESKVGKIEVVRLTASFSHYDFRPTNDESRECKFKQANKEDVGTVTKSTAGTGESQEIRTMATTRRGRFIRDGKPYDRPEHAKKKKAPRTIKTGMWNVGEELGRLVVEYHMTNTLWDWKIEPKRPDWPEVDLGTVVIDD